MAQIDASIYANQQSPNFLGAAEQGLRLKDMVRQNQFNEALKGSFTVDPTTGQQVVDPSKLRDIYNADPTRASQFFQQYNKSQLEMRNAQLGYHKQVLDMGAQMLGGAKDQASYDRIRPQLLQMGYHDEDLPKQYDPQTVDSLQKQSLSYSQRIDNDFKQKQLGIQQQTADAAVMKANAAADQAKTAASVAPSTIVKNQAEARKNASEAGTPGAAGPIDANTDPAVLVPTRVPQNLRAKALDEIKDIQNVKSIALPSLQAFDQAAREVRPTSGGLGTSLTAFVPGMESPGQKAWQGMANTTVKDVEGTARQAAFDSLAKNFKPQFGDSDATIAQKRVGWINYLKSHTSAPTNKAYGIDLGKFKSTALDHSAFAPMGGGIKMRAPDGTVRLVPADQAEAAKAAGGVPL